MSDPLCPHFDAPEERDHLRAEKEHEKRVNEWIESFDLNAAWAAQKAVELEDECRDKQSVINRLTLEIKRRDPIHH